MLKSITDKFRNTPNSPSSSHQSLDNHYDSESQDYKNFSDNEGEENSQTSNLSASLAELNTNIDSTADSSRDNIDNIEATQANLAAVESEFFLNKPKEVVADLPEFKTFQIEIKNHLQKENEATLDKRKASLQKSKQQTLEDAEKKHKISAVEKMDDLKKTHENEQNALKAELEKEKQSKISAIENEIDKDEELLQEINSRKEKMNNDHNAQNEALEAEINKMRKELEERLIQEKNNLQQDIEKIRKEKINEKSEGILSQHETKTKVKLGTLTYQQSEKQAELTKQFQQKWADERQRVEAEVDARNAQELQSSIETLEAQAKAKLDKALREYANENIVNHQAEVVENLTEAKVALEAQKDHEEKAAEAANTSNDRIEKAREAAEALKASEHSINTLQESCTSNQAETLSNTVEGSTITNEENATKDQNRNSPV
ncbi:MAG: hypothetical protein JWM09_712 [Francisellaceae bacterium]|nr:hypothetical protein [Francisellaceae bacterium]